DENIDELPPLCRIERGPDFGKRDFAVTDSPPNFRGPRVIPHLSGNLLGTHRNLGQALQERPLQGLVRELGPAFLAYVLRRRRFAPQVHPAPASAADNASQWVGGPAALSAPLGQEALALLPQT